jgi:hypothetical protein
MTLNDNYNAQERKEGSFLMTMLDMKIKLSGVYGRKMKWSTRQRTIWGWGLHRNKSNAPPNLGSENAKTRNNQ